MNAFLFMYPITHFFDFEVDRYKSRFDRNGYSIMRLHEIINQRYRKQDFQIYWLLFGKENYEISPDTSMSSNFFEILPEDKIISSGVSFNEFSSKKNYPDPRRVLEHIPLPVEELIIGGFHQQDCVERIAKFTYEAGINVFVDEDTTDFFFIKTCLFGELALTKNIREPLVFCCDSGAIVEAAKEYRKDRPWLAQIL